MKSNESRAKQNGLSHNTSITDIEIKKQLTDNVYLGKISNSLRHSAHFVIRYLISKKMGSLYFLCVSRDATWKISLRSIFIEANNVHLHCAPLIK